MTALLPHLVGTGPGDTFLVNLGCILGAILDTILHTGGHLWQLFASFWYPFFSDVFGTVSGTVLGGPMWLKHSKYCIRMRSPMLGKGSTLDQFWTTFGTLLGHFWHPLSLNGCPCRGLENHAILGSRLGPPCSIRVTRVNRFWGGSALIRIISNLQVT